ncbi:TonB-linked SusC/RagA family outer membrane protein [Arcticibacter tournemirensis]|uniref:TonB-dependent receptor n=2 Tax=Arcticibacter tournemirensis TaxID=699437 RepID=A0A5M9GPC4_9SPHI|nr:TonB-dependent receptor [Arcticibacter tournemirensis]TQM51259.1 TonB-linked SusC/RagA family outer membrane protein [Arcticibacter tournemirensis]
MIFLPGNVLPCSAVRRIFLRAMKLTTFFIFCGVMQIHAAGYSQSSFTLNEPNTTVGNVLKKIEKTSGYTIFYRQDQVNLRQKVHVVAENGSLQSVMKQVLQGQPLDFEILNDIVIIKPADSDVGQQEIISGTISDPGGEPLIGASVIVKGTTNGASTDAGGKFVLRVKGNAPVTLLIKYIGYASKEVSASPGQTGLKITLEADGAALEEVVVVGYGQQQKKDVTGSVSTVSAQRLRDLPVTSVDQKLVGQVPGLLITSPTGAPGGGTGIKIRGSGSIGAGDNPLFVVDGFAISNTSGQTYNPLNIINPEDIESITVLKDASSTAIYGSRGANGVVVITTKRGKTGPPVVNVNAYAGSQTIPQKGRPQVLNGTEYAQFRRDIIVDDRTARGLATTDADIPEAFRNPAQYGEGTDWYSEILRTAPQYNVDASVRGGSESTRYSFSLGRLTQEGTVRYTDYERYSIQANLESDLSSKLKIGLNLAPTAGTQNRNSFETGFRDIITRALWLSPIVPALDASGNRTPYITSPGAIGAPNPLNSLEFAGTKEKFFRGIGSAFAEYEIIKGLKAKYSFNVDYSANRSFNFNPSTVGGESSPPPVVPNSNTGRSNTTNWLSELVVSYDKAFGDHRLNTVVGYTAQEERNETISIFATNYPDDLVKTINAATQIRTWGEGVEKWSLLSYLARVNYSFKDKYLLTATIRSDGSSRFGANNRYGTFPSAAIGWRVSQEDFIKDISWISDLKLRASYGRSGNFNIGNYTYTSSVGRANYAFGGQLANGRVSTSLNNRDLTWENSDEFDAGMDLGLFRTRLNLTVDYYNRITTAMLYTAEIPFASGFGSAIVNLGKIRNRGLEVGLNSRILEGDFTWNTNFNISFNRNKVLALNANNDPIYSGRSGEGSYTHKTEVGKPLGQFFGFVMEGLYTDAQDLANSPKHPTSVVGSVKYKDVDGNGIIEAVKDFAVIGNPQADFTYGFTNSFGYKNFDLNVLLVGSQGGQILKTANEYLTNIDGVFNVDRKVLNRWRSPENPGDGMTPTTNGARVIYRDVNSTWVEDASYLRIQNISLGYNFKQSFIGSSQTIKGLRLYGSVQNVATFTNYSGANPEASTSGSSVLVPGRDFTNYPLPRIVTFGVNMTF